MAEIVREAGQMVLAYFETGEVPVHAKGTMDVVTAADLESERFIADALRAAFPQDGIVAEEGARSTARGERCWYIDPLDGTLNFSRGLPVWCVTVSLFEEGEPVLGVVLDPVRREMFSGATGLGAWCNDQALTGSHVTALNQALVQATVDFHDDTLHAGLRDLNAIAPCVLRTRNLGAAALTLAYIAAGRMDAMLHRYAHPWDYGAAVAIVQAAGGVVTAMNGDRYSAEVESIAAAGTPELHQALLDLLSDADNNGVGSAGASGQR
ncbi:MAG: inositol monophosphatase family protein [Chloroflexota bacterium]